MKYPKFFVVFLFFLIYSSVGQASVPKKFYKGGVQPQQITVTWASRIIQGFNMRVWLSNQMKMGLQAWDCGIGNCIPDEPHLGLEYPIGSSVEHLYGAGPWIGAIINGIPFVTEGYNGDDARSELYPNFQHLTGDHFWRTAVSATQYDTLGYSGYYYNNGIIVNRKGFDDDLDTKIDEDELDGIDNDGDWNPLTDDVGSDGLPDSLELSCNGKPYNQITNPDPAGDNYDPSMQDSCHPNPDGSLPFKNNRDRWTENNGIPDHGEPHVDEDYGAISDNDLYCSATDTFNTPRVGGHIPMGIKIIQKSYAWKFGSGADAIIPLEYKFVNVGRRIWNDVYIGFFADMDVGPTNVTGFYQHNYAAYDSLTRTAFIHNPVDRGSTPLGLTLLQTSKPLDSLKYIFQWFDFTTHIGPGTIDSNIYGWMSGEAIPGPLIAPNQNPSNLSDTRFFISFGPFTQMTQYDTVKAIFTLVSGLTVEKMLANAQRAKQIFDSLTLDVKEKQLAIPSDFALSQNYPNPFNPSTKIRFALPTQVFVTIKVYDILGIEVATLVNESKHTGTYEIEWDASGLASGVYFYQIRAGSFTSVKKMLIAK